jgi:hypothetical protein
MNPAWPRRARLARFPGLGLLSLLLISMASGTSDGSDSDRTFGLRRQSHLADIPVMAIVSLRDQRVTIYDVDGGMLRAPVSTGQIGYETPAGIYSVIQKEAEHYSNLYDDAEMPFMQRITWSGIALHAGKLPGYAASHGCIRLPYVFAERLFGLTKKGMRVIVSPRDIEPADIEHPALFKPITMEVEQTTTLSNSSANQSMQLVSTGPTLAPKRVQTAKWLADTKAADADAATQKARDAWQAYMPVGLEAARLKRTIWVAEAVKLRAEVQLKVAEDAVQTAGASAAEYAADAKANAAVRLTEAQSQLDALKSQGQPKLDAAAAALEVFMAAEAVRVAAVNASRVAAAKLTPVTVFISRQTQRLYVRQRFQPLFDTPVTISDRDRALGTHVYTALEYAKDGTNLRWSVVSMSKGAFDRDSDDRRWRHDRVTQAAKAALDRITIPQQAIDRISNVISPGSALIVSDEAMSKETGAATDFIVLMSNEPQGGIKGRQRGGPGRYQEYLSAYRFYRRSPYGGGLFSWW